MQLLAHQRVPDDDASDEAILLTLSERDRKQAVLALTTVLGEIDAEEFHTRLGGEPTEAEALLASLLAIGVTRDPDPPGAAEHQALPDDRSDGLVVAMTEAQLVLVNNALNEGLHGLAPEYVAPGFHASEAEALLDAVGTILDALEVAPSGAPGERSYLTRIR